MSEFFLMLFDLFYFHWAVDNGLLYLISAPPPLSTVEDVPFLLALKIKDKIKLHSPLKTSKIYINIYSDI